MKGLGIVLIILACHAIGFWALWHFTEPSEKQVETVVAPLIRLPLQAGSFRHSLSILNDPEWQAVRRNWGEPHFYLAAVTSDRDGPRVCSRSEAPLAAQMTVSGERLGLSSCDGDWPYGYSVLTPDAQCQTFTAPLGAMCTVRGALEQPSSCELIIVSNYATKDRLVGASLHREYDGEVNGTALLGAALGLVGAALMRIAGKKAVPPSA